jgi:hypothetical protein
MVGGRGCSVAAQPLGIRELAKRLTQSMQLPFRSSTKSAAPSGRHKLECSTFEGNGTTERE